MIFFCKNKSFQQQVTRLLYKSLFSLSVRLSVCNTIVIFSAAIEYRQLKVLGKIPYTMSEHPLYNLLDALVCR